MAKFDAILGELRDQDSTNDYTTAEKNKLSGIETGAEVNNISDVNATDLTDSGATTLHKHDHGNLDGLTDDDHTQYTQKSILTAKGDIYVATEDSTPDNLAIGDDRAVLTADSSEATGVKWEAPHIPYGLPSWYIYDQSSYYNSSVKSAFTLDGNFTFVKRWNARITAVSSKFVDITNSAGDRIQIWNSGYNLVCTVTVAGVVLYTDSVATSTVFTSGVTDTTAMFEVDYDNEEIRITTSIPTSKTYSIAGLSALKTSVFTSINLGINSYVGGCMYSFIVKDLWNYTNRGYILNATYNFPRIETLGKTVHDILSAQPTSFVMSGSTKAFSGGSVTYSYAELAALPTGNNKYGGHKGYTFDQDLVYYNPSKKNVNIKYGFSITVENASVYFKSASTSNTYNVRLIEKNTGVITDTGAVATYTEYEIPVGEWWLEYTGEVRFTSYTAGALDYLLSWGSADVDATITVYNDATYRPQIIVFSAFPQMATYTKGYCPFSDQYADGNWGLAAQYV